MMRTIITLPEQDKEWLDAFSHQNHQSIAETIRRAIRFFRENVLKGSKKSLLQQTRGIWSHKKINGARYVESFRKEWDR